MATTSASASSSRLALRPSVRCATAKANSSRPSCCCSRATCSRRISWPAWRRAIPRHTNAAAGPAPAPAAATPAGRPPTAPRLPAPGSPTRNVARPAAQCARESVTAQRAPGPAPATAHRQSTRPDARPAARRTDRPSARAVAALPCSFAHLQAVQGAALALAPELPAQRAAERDDQPGQHAEQQSCP